MSSHSFYFPAQPIFFPAQPIFFPAQPIFFPAQPIFFPAQPFTISCAVNFFFCAAIFQWLRNRFLVVAEIQKEIAALRQKKRGGDWRLRRQKRIFNNHFSLFYCSLKCFLFLFLVVGRRLGAGRGRSANVKCGTVPPPLAPSRLRTSRRFCFHFCRFAICLLLVFGLNFGCFGLFLPLKTLIFALFKKSYQQSAFSLLIPLFIGALRPLFRPFPFLFSTLCTSAFWRGGKGKKTAPKNPEKQAPNQRKKPQKNRNEKRSKNKPKSRKKRLKTLQKLLKSTKNNKQM